MCRRGYQNHNVYIFGLFVWGFTSHFRVFHSFGNVSITGEGLQILIYAPHLWPLSSEGSSTWHTNCDKGHPFIKVISEDPWHSHLLPSVWQWSCYYLFLRLRSVEAWIRTINLLLAGRTLYRLRHRTGDVCINRMYWNETCIGTSSD